jgi:hypothetical protein
MNHADYIVRLNQDIDVFVEGYKDCSVTRLYEEFDVNEGAKNRLNVLIKQMITYSESSALKQIERKDEFCLKTIKLDKYGRLKESMSFPVFKYCELVKENWETSSLRQTFAGNIFVFAIFKNEGKELYLNRIKVWEMPESVLESGVRDAWSKMKDCLLTGNIVKYIDDYGRYFTYFPSSTENQYVHVRPHAQNRDDTLPLPVADKLTGLVEYPKHSFWLNRSYVAKIISED